MADLSGCGVSCSLKRSGPRLEALGKVFGGVGC